VCLILGCFKRNRDPFQTKVDVLDAANNRGLVTYGYSDGELLFACFVMTTNRLQSVKSPLIDIASGTRRHHCRLDLPDGRSMVLPQKRQMLIEIANGTCNISESELRLTSFTNYLSGETNLFSVSRLLDKAGKQ
jgi:hypothetical protein